MKALVIILIAFINFSSCVTAQKKDSNNINQKINSAAKLCINQSVKELPTSHFNLILLFEEIENLLIQESFLKDNSIMAYRELFSELESNKENEEYKSKLQSIYGLIQEKNENVTWLITPELFNVSANCILKSIKEHNTYEIEYYSEYKELLTEFLEAGRPEDWSLNNRFLASTPSKDFSKVAFRSPFISLIYGNIVFNR